MLDVVEKKSPLLNCLSHLKHVYFGRHHFREMRFVQRNVRYLSHPIKDSMVENSRESNDPLSCHHFASSTSTCISALLSGPNNPMFLRVSV